jgi:hypothetical protein
MEENTHYWLNRVAVKLYRTFVAGADFELNEHRWVFDWNNELTTEENLTNVVAEDRALIVFTTIGAVVSSSKVNYFRDQQLEALANPEKEGIGMWGERWEATDPAHREYDYITFVDSFDYKEFKQFCKEQGLNYKEEAVPATLEITNQVPIIHVGNEAYSLKTLQTGSTLDVLQAAYDHIDIRFGFTELRRWTNKTFVAQERFTDIFRKRKNEFSKESLLSPFADITAQTFMLKKHAGLTPSQLSAIQKARTN